MRTVTQTEPSTCTWVQDDDGSETFATSCGDHFNLEGGNPEESGLRFCCYCGKPLQQELVESEGCEVLQKERGAAVAVTSAIMQRRAHDRHSHRHQG
jgi:predicted amidophosphoribosyltransferase